MIKEIERILKLDQAGEYGAIEIYSAQLLVARILYNDIVSKLEEMIVHEKEHYKTFNSLLIARSMKPFGVLKLWAVGGFLLGFSQPLWGASQSGFAPMPLKRPCYIISNGSLNS